MKRILLWITATAVILALIALVIPQRRLSSDNLEPQVSSAQRKAVVWQNAAAGASQLADYLVVEAAPLCGRQHCRSDSVEPGRNVRGCRAHQTLV